MGSARWFLDAPDAGTGALSDRKRGKYIYLRKADELRVFIGSCRSTLPARLAGSGAGRQPMSRADLAAFNERLAFVRRAAAPGFKYRGRDQPFRIPGTAAPPEVVDLYPLLPLACRDPKRNANGWPRNCTKREAGRCSGMSAAVRQSPILSYIRPLVEARLIGWFTHWAGAWTVSPLLGILPVAGRPVASGPAGGRRAWSAGDMFFVLPGNDGRSGRDAAVEGLAWRFRIMNC